MIDRGFYDEVRNLSSAGCQLELTIRLGSLTYGGLIIKQGVDPGEEIRQAWLLSYYNQENLYL